VTATVTTTVTAQPIRTARIAYAASVVVLVAFVLVALLMKKYSDGAHFSWKDQLFTVVIGVILAGLCIMPTRPRLRADSEAVRLRNYLGGWRTVPWELIERVEFPAKSRFARIVLPGEEIFAIYAVQRMDRERSVAVMRELRALLAATRAGG
jgi:hypothetical protein